MRTLPFRRVLFNARCYANGTSRRVVSVCLSVRPSVRVSVTFVHCIETAKDIIAS